ncbi:MAG: DNA polymerase III subunit delta [Bacteroidetes bacterium]|nr:DNA polymerase III subunit delta [Bacteroidota bacterium]
MLFKDIIGQEALKKRLIQSVNDNRLSHGQLFTGPEGSGTLALSIAYIQYINCEARTAEDSCGICPSCIKYNKLAHPDLHFVFPVTSTKAVTGTNIKSDDFILKWREAVVANPYLSINNWYEAMGVENKQGIINVNDSDEVVKKLSLKAYEAEYKAMIIWMAEKMNTQAANKLLKILEEPPDKTIFILISEQFGQLLATITSRTQLIKVNKIDDKDMIKHLVEKQGLSEQNAGQVTFLASGNFNLAKNIMSEGGEDDFFTSNFITWMRLCYGARVPDVMQWLDVISKAGREKQKSFFDYALEMVRECLLLNYSPDKGLNRINKNEAEFLKKFSPFIHGANCILITEELNKASYHIERNANPRILFLDLSLKLMKLLRIKA